MVFLMKKEAQPIPVWPSRSGLCTYHLVRNSHIQCPFLPHVKLSDPRGAHLTEEQTGPSSPGHLLSIIEGSQWLAGYRARGPDLAYYMVL